MEKQQKYYSGCFITGIILALICIGIFGGSFRTDVINYVPHNMETVEADTTINMDFTSKHFLGGIIKGKQANPQWYISRIEEEGYQLSKIEVGTKHTLGNVLLTFVTASIYSPLKVEVKASFVKKE